MGSVTKVAEEEPRGEAAEAAADDDGPKKSVQKVLGACELCEIKDEHGQTVLHLAAGKPQEKGVLYRMIASAEYLIPERDENYRTIRDIALEAGLKDNVQKIDNYILNAFIRRNVVFARRLAQEGYDLLKVYDAKGNDIVTVLRRRNIQSMINLLQDIYYFQKSRDELHTFIKNDYVRGVIELMQIDNKLVTAKNSRGRTALHLAVLFGNLNIVARLLKADPNSVNIQDNVSAID